MKNDKFTVHLIVAARPNFMKVAPLYHVLIKQDWCQPILVHTGQHYDRNMSDTFLKDLGLPDPDIHLHVGSGSHAEQTAGVMLAYEKVCQETPPDWIIVVGDVNSTMAVAITAKKMWLPVAHLEAGLRSGDRTMPEEINRLVTDAICDLLWTPSPDADENLRREGVAEEKIVRVGNIMMDSYEMLKPKIDSASLPAGMNLQPNEFGVVTLHRPSNVDHQETLTKLVDTLVEISAELPLVYPIHPRAMGQLESFSLLEKLKAAKNLHLLEPLGYIPFMKMVGNAKIVITDSGGIQEETTYLNIPCLTLRNNTERPITISQGTNQLVDPDTLHEKFHQIMNGVWKKGTRPELWDGQTALRVVASLKSVMKV